MELTTYNCFVGTSRGFLLSTTDKPNEIKHVKPEFSSEVTALTFGKKQAKIFVGYQNGYIHVYDTLENAYLTLVPDLVGSGSIVGLGCIGKVLIAGKSDGTVNIWNGTKNKHFNINLSDNSTVNCVGVNNKRNSLATGGECNDLKLWDIETQQCVFKAKSMGHDHLNLPIPTSITGITFFPEDIHLSSCCTKEGHVLIYDDRIQRRPVVKFFETKASYTTISSAYRERQCLVGTTKGYMQRLDMKAGKCMSTFTTFTGSVTSIACDTSQPYIFSTSLDRYLRVHHLDTKELLHKVYMKVNLTSVLIKPVVKEELVETEDNCAIQKVHTEQIQDVDQEYENIFDKLEVIGEKIKKKSKGKKVDESNDEQVLANLGEKIKKKKSKLVNESVDEQVVAKKLKKLEKDNDSGKIKAKRKVKISIS